MIQDNSSALATLYTMWFLPQNVLNKTGFSQYSFQFTFSLSKLQYHPPTCLQRR